MSKSLPKSKASKPTTSTTTSDENKDTSDAESKQIMPSIEHDRYLLEWLKDVKHSIIVTSYKTNYIFSIGHAMLLEPEQREQLSFWMTQSPRCMGAAKSDNGQTLWIGNMSYLTKYKKFGDKHPDEGEGYKRTPFDIMYVPRKVHVTSDIDIHDIVVPNGSTTPHFVSAVYSCVCTPSEDHSFKVYWKPPWISKIAAEDRTHLNGLCCVNGQPRYVTAASRTDVRGGWREHKQNGGVIYDIVADALVCKNLSMPHSPRWNNNKLWVLNSGTGHFGYVDFSRTVVDENDNEEYYPFVPKCFIPGFLRGLDFVGDRYAIIGSSDDRHEKTFQDLELGETLKKKKTSAKCGVHVVDLNSFDVLHEITFDKPITELYDVVAVPHFSRPIIDEMIPLGLSRRLDFEE